ncbi:MAG: cobyrinate a,c-diamide synthase [Candidatus Zixiibacteriota bacterium]
MNIKVPRLLIAGLSGDSGKTIASLSLLTLLRQKGLAVSVYKKGPDYIDAAWLAHASGGVCYNLDTYMADSNEVVRTFMSKAKTADLALVEGNRGIFDGKDISGTHSTAELAKLLKAPVALVVDATKTTRTVAALVKGCIDFDPEVKIAGVILNRVAGKRHEKIITEAIEKYCGLPVVGVIPKIAADSDLLPGRHLGLVPPSEFKQADALDEKLRRIAEEYLDSEALLKIAAAAPGLESPVDEIFADVKTTVKIGYFRDSVFTFYYPDNLEALRREGAELVPVSSLDDRQLPDIDALYIGGGFPETHAERLVANKDLMISVKRAVEEGLPVYAECGGLIYLARTLRRSGETFAMTGVFPVDLTMRDKPVGHGYTLMEIDTGNPFFEIGTQLKGHEFHYSGLVADELAAVTSMTVRRGFGIDGRRDGLLYKNCLACYTHIHAAGVKGWAKAVAAAARKFSFGAKSEKRVEKKIAERTERSRVVEPEPVGLSV